MLSLQVTELLEQSAPKRPAAPAPESNGHSEPGAPGAAHDLPNGDASAAPATSAPAGDGAAPLADDMETDVAPASAAETPSAAAPSLKPEDERYLERFERLRGILDGTASISHYLEFLYSHNHADLQVRCCLGAQTIDALCLLDIPDVSRGVPRAASPLHQHQPYNGVVDICHRLGEARDSVNGVLA